MERLKKLVRYLSGADIGEILRSKLVVATFPSCLGTHMTTPGALRENALIRSEVSCLIQVPEHPRIFSYYVIHILLRYVSLS